MKSFSVSRLKDKNENLNFENSQIVRQPYTITMAKHDLNVHEYRVVLRIIQYLQKDMLYDKKSFELKNKILNKTIHIPTNELMIKGSQNYACVKNALKELQRKLITVEGRDDIGKYETSAAIITGYKYYLNNQMISITLDRHLLVEYIALAKNYTRYLIDIAFNTTSVYTMKIYQLLSHWQDKNCKNVMIDELKKFLQIEGKYKKSKDFRKGVLETVYKELKEKANLWFEIKNSIKVGKKIVGYNLKIIFRKEYEEQQKAKSLHIDNLKELLRRHYGLKTSHLEKIAHVINNPDLHSQIYAKISSGDLDKHIEKSNVRNIPAYVVKCFSGLL